jgi:hypothetical protein
MFDHLAWWGVVGRGVEIGAAGGCSERPRCLIGGLLEYDLFLIVMAGLVPTIHV